MLHYTLYITKLSAITRYSTKNNSSYTYCTVLLLYIIIYYYIYIYISYKQQQETAPKKKQRQEKKSPPHRGSPPLRCGHPENKLPQPRHPYTVPPSLPWHHDPRWISLTSCSCSWLQLAGKVQLFDTNFETYQKKVGGLKTVHVLTKFVLQMLKTSKLLNLLFNGVLHYHFVKSLPYINCGILPIRWSTVWFSRALTASWQLPGFVGRFLRGKTVPVVNRVMSRLRKFLRLYQVDTPITTILSYLVASQLIQRWTS